LPVVRFYWNPLQTELTKLFPQTTIFTALWPGFAKGYEDAFTVDVVGKLNYIEATKETTGYGSGFTYLSPGIIGKLLKL
jgi:hypothetical protein